MRTRPGQTQPKGRRAATPDGIVDTLKHWEQQGEELERGLRLRRAQLVAEMSIIDTSLAVFEKRRSARYGEPPSRGEPRQPGSRRAAPDPLAGGRTIVAKVRSTGPDTAEAIIDATATELRDFKPFWFALKDKTRQIVELRAEGKTAAAIGEKLDMTGQAVSNRVFAARARLRTARQAGEKPQDQPGDGAGDDEPDPAAKESETEEQPQPPPAEVPTPAGVEPIVTLPVSAPSVRPAKEEVAEIIPAAATVEERTETQKIIPEVIPAALPVRRAAQLLPATSHNSPSASLKPICQPIRRLSAGRSPVAPHAAPAGAEALPAISDDDLEDFDTPLIRIRRRSTRTGKDGRVRSKTIAPGRLRKDEVKLGELLTHPAHIVRPLTRRDCEDDPGRPCPWVSCSHHLYLEVNPETGAIKLNFPHLEVWEMPNSCSLDVADRGGITLEEVGAILNLTRERIRQVETRGIGKIKDHGDNELGLPPDRRT